MAKFACGCARSSGRSVLRLVGSPPAGDYSLEVLALATAQSLTSPAYTASANLVTASANLVGSGTLTLRFGTISGASFAEDTGQAAVDITIDSGATLADLGLATERDDTFRLDTARLQATLARDPEGATAMFINGLFGVYATVDKIARSASVTGNPGSSNKAPI